MAVPTVWINLETPKIVELLVSMVIMHILSRIFSPRFLLFYDNLNLILTELEEVRKKGDGWLKINSIGETVLKIPFLKSSE